MLIVAGLDPGAETGFAEWDVSRVMFRSVQSMQMHQAILQFELWRKSATLPALVIFEDARKSRIGGGRTFGNVQRLQGVGSVKRDCSIWQEYLEDCEIPYIAAAPIRGGTKWTSDYFAAVTHWSARTNNHGRDAAVRVLGLNEPQVVAMIREWRQRHPLKGVA